MPDANAGYGIYCGERNGIFVVDLDIKPGKDGLRAWEELCAAYGEPIPDTFTVATGSGGFHFYFKHPGRPVKTSTSRLAKGVDVIGDGGARSPSWVVGPGSPHVSGNPYVVLRDVPIAEAPGWLLDWPGLYKPAAECAVQGDRISFYEPLFCDPSTEEGQRRMRAFRAECSGEVGDFPPSIAGEKGHNRLLTIAIRGVTEWLLPIANASEIIAQYFNPRCSPPWTEAEIQRKCREAIKVVAVPTGVMPERFGERLTKLAILGTSEVEAPTQLRERDENHQYQCQIGTVIASGKLDSASKSEITFRLTRSPEWNGVLRYDELFNVVRAVCPPVGPLDCERGDTGLSDTDVDAISVWFEVYTDRSIDRERMRGCLELAARNATVHPIREYFKSLPPGDPRVLDTLLEHLWGGTDALEVDLFRRFLVGAVRRVLNPGCQMDNMVVLFGHQGFHKTQFVRHLFGFDWSSQQMPDISSKDGSQGIASVWGQEIGELDRFLRVDSNTAKDFLSRCVDYYRPAYGRTFIKRPRQCVFVGTTNKQEFLRDPTGERRYWVINVTRDIDIDWLIANRNSIWAAAYALAQDEDFHHWITEGTEIAAQLKERQEPYAETDAWETSIVEYCSGRDWVALDEVFRVGVMKCDLSWLIKWDNRMQERVMRVMRRIGCVAAKRDEKKGFTMPAHIRDRKPSPEALRERATFGERLIAAVKVGK